MSKIVPFPIRPRTACENAEPGRRSPLTDDEIILAAYINGATDTDLAVTAACDRIGVPESVRCERIAAAAGQVLIQWVQHNLPHWAIRKNGEWVRGREYRRRRHGVAVSIVPQLLFEINWADSAPGLSWPESYHLAYVPEHHRYVVVASQDGTDVWGCNDQALGHFAPRERRLVGARRLLISHWRYLFENFTQEPWKCVLKEGLVDEVRATRWRDHVWPDGPEY